MSIRPDHQHIYDHHIDDRAEDEDVIDAEIVDDGLDDTGLDDKGLDDAPTQPLPVVPGAELVPMAPPSVPVARAVLTLRTRALPVVRAAATARPVLTAGRVAGSAARVTVRNSWYLAAGAGVAYRRWQDAHGAGRYERMMRRAEAAGDHESLLEWETRGASEKQARHQRVMDWVRSPVELVKAVGIGLLGLLGLLVLLGVVLALGRRDITQVIAPVVGVIDFVLWVAWFLTAYSFALLLGVTVVLAVWLWQMGRAHAHVQAPAWATPATATGDGEDAAGGRDVVPDERAVVNALRNLNLPELNRKFREGWAPRWELPPAYDGKGWRCQFLLPEGVTVTKINDRKEVLAHNLLRLPVEVWPTQPRDKPGYLDLWVADQGSLTKPVAPWPLLHSGTVDYFKGVPVGVDLRGKPVIGRFFQANWGVAGMMGSGKSTLIITALLGLSLDPLVEIDVYCMAVNADYDPLKPRLRTLFVSDDPDQVPAVLAALKDLMSDLSARGRKLSAAGEPKLTRKLAEADPGMRPRVVVIDECQELFVSDVGPEATELVEKIVAKARKYGVTLIFATPVPSADSLPRKVAKVLSNRACFAIGDHQGNDAMLGTGKHTAGITATTLRPMTIDADGTVDLGDLGTAMTVGFTPTDGLMRCYYVRRGDGIDDVTPVVERAMAAYQPTPPPTENADVDEVDAVDLVADLLAVIRAAGPDHLMLAAEAVTGLAALRPAHYRGLTITKLADELPDGAKPYKTRNGSFHVNADRLAAHHHTDDPDPTDLDEPDDADTPDDGE